MAASRQPGRPTSCGRGTSKRACTAAGASPGGPPTPSLTTRPVSSGARACPTRSATSSGSASRSASSPCSRHRREPGFQAAIESFNGLWQRKVWARHSRAPLEELAAASARYIAASRLRHAVRIGDAPPRRPLPPDEPLNLWRPQATRIVILRRASDTGAAVLLNRRYVIDATWVHRLVRAELDLVAGRIDVFALRRADPTHQPQLATFAYHPPARWFS